MYSLCIVMMLILHTVNEVKKHILTDNNLSIPVPSKVSKMFWDHLRNLFIQRELYEPCTFNHRVPLPMLTVYFIMHVIIH